jgi:hypothetical protein
MLINQVLLKLGLPICVPNSQIKKIAYKVE